MSLSPSATSTPPPQPEPSTHELVPDFTLPVETRLTPTHTALTQTHHALLTQLHALQQTVALQNQQLEEFESRVDTIGGKTEATSSPGLGLGKENRKGFSSSSISSSSSSSSSLRYHGMPQELASDALRRRALRLQQTACSIKALRHAVRHRLPLQERRLGERLEGKRRALEKVKTRTGWCAPATTTKTTTSTTHGSETHAVSFQQKMEQVQAMRELVAQLEAERKAHSTLMHKKDELITTLGQELSRRREVYEKVGLTRNKIVGVEKECEKVRQAIESVKAEDAQIDAALQDLERSRDVVAFQAVEEDVYLLQQELQRQKEIAEKQREKMSVVQQRLRVLTRRWSNMLLALRELGLDKQLSTFSRQSTSVVVSDDQVEELNDDVDISLYELFQRAKLKLLHEYSVKEVLIEEKTQTMEMLQEKLLTIYQKYIQSKRALASERAEIEAQISDLQEKVVLARAETDAKAVDAKLESVSPARTPARFKNRDRSMKSSPLAM